MKKTKIAQLHDTLVRHFLSATDLAASLIRSYIPPELSDLMDLDNLVLLSTGLVDKKLSSYFSDLRYATTFKANGRKSEVFIFLEHQSTPDRLIAFRLLRYIVKSFEERLREGREEGTPGGDKFFPYPVAIVLYNGKKPWRNFPHMADLLDSAPGAPGGLLQFPLYLVDLAALLPEELAASGGHPAIRALLATLRAVPQGTMESEFDRVVDMLREAVNDRRTLDWMTALITYIWERYTFLSTNMIERVYGNFTEKAEARKMAISTAEQLRREGRAEGRAEGMALSTCQFLNIRFGTIPEALHESILAEKNIKRLEKLCELAAKCDSLDDFAKKMKE